MAANRLPVLLSLVEANPADSFARYGLAMEYVRAGDFERAAAEFRTLLEHNPGYAAAYYHAGQTLEKLDRSEEAREMYERGIQVTTRSGDAHTRSELQTALDLL